MTLVPAFLVSSGSSDVLNQILDTRDPPFMQTKTSSMFQSSKVQSQVQYMLKTYNLTGIPCTGLTRGDTATYHYMGFPSNTFEFNSASVVGTPAVSDLRHVPAVTSAAFQLATDAKGNKLDADVLSDIHAFVVEDTYHSYMASLDQATPNEQTNADTFQLMRAEGPHAKLYGYEDSPHIKASYVHLLPQKAYEEANAVGDPLSRPQRSAHVVDLAGTVVIHELAEGNTFGCRGSDTDPTKKRILITAYLPLREQLSDNEMSRDRYLRMLTYTAHNLYSAIAAWNQRVGRPQPVFDSWFLHPVEEVLNEICYQDAEGRYEAGRRYLKRQKSHVKAIIYDIKEEFDYIKRRGKSRHTKKQIKRLTRELRRRLRQLKRYTKSIKRKDYSGVRLSQIECVAYAKAGLEASDFWTFGKTSKFSRKGDARTLMEFMAAWWTGFAKVDKNLQTYFPLLEMHAEGCAVGSRWTTEAKSLVSKYAVKLGEKTVGGIKAMNGGVAAAKVAQKPKQ